MRLPSKIAIAALIGAVVALPGAAHAAYPGANGKIAFERAGQIWTINPDGTGETQLTTGPFPSSEPDWSPDGSRIAYTHVYTSCPGGSCREVRIMNADGSGDHRLFPSASPTIAGSPSWSPDGRRIAYAHYVLTCCGIIYWVISSVDAGGTNPQSLLSIPETPFSDLEWSPRGDEIGFTAVDTGADETDALRLNLATFATQSLTIDPDENTAAPAWAPDAADLAFLSDLGGGPQGYEIWTMHRDGTAREQVLNTGARKFGVDWSPDRSKLIFAGWEVGCTSNCDTGLYLVNPDGSGTVPLTNTAASELGPDWQPVVGLPPAGYPRPRGASPMSVSLVPAYQACTASNRTHGAPLAFPSCTPPAQSSPRLTLGTPDANGAPVRSTASLVLKVVAGDEATEANEADVKLTFNATDVRCYAGDTRDVCTASNTQAGRDYAGNLRLRVGLRLTDRYNLPAQAGNGPGTTSDTPREANLTALGCTTTPSDGSVGSTCSINTSLRALLGVTEGHRAVMELGQVEVLDGGASGDVGGGTPSSGMSTFLRQGIFIP